MGNNDVYDEQALLDRLRQGDMDAFDVIYRRYVRELYLAAYKRLDNKELVEDLVQDVFFRLWNRRDQLHIDNLGAYLHTAVRYEILNHITRHKAPAAFYAPFEAILADADTPENRLIAKELLELVYKYAETLPEKRKQVFLLHIKDKLSVNEIAEELNITTKTVHNHLGTAINGLRTHLAPAILLLLTTHR
ncbi:RNA polymerase sigma factor [Dinghuibacter silviterrae]|uniref:RNA polymerase sigma-70 factor (ECF subfamily) n=1 Tax=Dinghuibacter silviterrae TaxID=1539049 RepID=A0A4V3GKY7_9BACT|nr:RNA polymerase sigma-70 factor [Dinghuibacter silviterrae]TDW97472.1 RNA polymerase sigma-70 factor (ECF subfamily) [Dinghuibacter silviterrae]